MFFFSLIFFYLGLLFNSLIYLFLLGLNLFKVERCISQLKLIGKGDIVGAKRLDSDSKDSSSHPENSEGRQKLGSKLHESEAVNPKEWTSLQLTEAMLVLNKFLKVKYKKCKNCDAKNPAITKPTFGWFHTVYILFSLSFSPFCCRQ